MYNLAELLLTVVRDRKQVLTISPCENKAAISVMLTDPVKLQERESFISLAAIAESSVDLLAYTIDRTSDYLALAPFRGQLPNDAERRNKCAEILREIANGIEAGRLGEHLEALHFMHAPSPSVEVDQRASIGSTLVVTTLPGVRAAVGEFLNRIEQSAAVPAVRPS